MVLKALNGVVVVNLNHACLDVVTVIPMTNVLAPLFVVAITAKINFQFPELTGTLKQIAVLVCINTKNTENQNISFRYTQ